MFVKEGEVLCFVCMWFFGFIGRCSLGFGVIFWDFKSGGEGWVEFRW